MRTKIFSLACVFAVLAAAGCKPPPTANTVSGTIETDEARVASRYGGRVEKLFAGEGDALTNGQLIVELEAAELRAQRAQAAARLSELEAGPRPEEISAAKHDWESLVAQLEFVRSDARRIRELVEQKTLPESERDRAVSQEHALEKSAAAARSRYDLLLAGTRPEQILQARARLAEIDTQWREMRILAPTHCVLEVLNVKVGDVLAPNQPVATLLHTNRLWVRVFVPERWLGHLHLGQTVRVKVDPFPDKEFQGTVEQINRAAEFTPRNTQTVAERIKQVFGVKVRLDNPGGVLRAGMSADVVFQSLPK